MSDAREGDQKDDTKDGADDIMNKKNDADIHSDEEDETMSGMSFSMFLDFR